MEENNKKMLETIKKQKSKTNVGTNQITPTTNNKKKGIK